MGAEKRLSDGTRPYVGMMVTAADNITDDGIWSYYLGKGEIVRMDSSGCNIRCIELTGENGRHYEHAASNMDLFYGNFNMLKRCEDIPFDEDEFLGLI